MEYNVNEDFITRLRKLLASEFYGSVEISITKGEIAYVRETKTLKPKDFLVD